MPKSEQRHYLDRGLMVEGLTIAARTTKRRDIYVHPRARKDWTIFAHELLHALLEEMGEHRRERGWIKRPITHRQITKLAVPLGAFLRENLK